MGPAIHNQLYECGLKTTSQDGFLMDNYETQLFQSLNRFINFINNANQSASNKEQNTKFCKSSSNFLRLKLLTVLRQWCDSSRSNCTLEVRDVLTQWWVTLLNFLNSDTSLQIDTAHELSLSIELTSVCLECLSKIMTILIILPFHSSRDMEIYSHHLLLTIHCITNKLILISKNSKKLKRTNSDDKCSINDKKLQYLNKYSSLLRAFIGKLNAYAFFYLPEDLHFDTILLLTVSPQISSSIQTSLFSWKKRQYEFTDDQGQMIRTEAFENKDTKFFKIIVSYIKNDFVLMSFYWHYWYIILQFMKFSDSDVGIKKSTLSCIPGSEILLTHVTTRFLNSDLNKFTRIIKQTPNPRIANENVTESHPNFKSLNSSNALITSERINDYVFSNFKTIKLWECLRSLSGCILKENHPEYLENMLSLHESLLIDYVSTISAYDYIAANVIYNKVLQFIIFQFESLPSLKFIQWRSWYNGLLSMLRTKNVNCQTVSLLCLFNIWKYVTIEDRDEIVKVLLSDFWESLIFENEFPLIRILFMKVLVFKIIPSVQNSSSLRFLPHDRIKQLYEELLVNKEELFEMQKHDSNDIVAHRKNALVFNGNSRLMMIPKKPNTEDHLVYKINHDKNLTTERFPSVSSVANTRPNVILKNGKYAYDILDEMTSKAAFLLAEKKTRLNPKKNHKIMDGYEGGQENEDNDEDSEDSGSHKNKRKEGNSSLSATLNTWLSKFSSTSEDSQKKKEQANELGNDFEYDEDVADFAEILPKQSSSNIEKIFKHGNSSGSMVSSNSSIKLNRRENILIGPPELRFSNEIKEHNSITTIFKLVFIQTNRRVVEKIDLANMKWGTIHGGSKYMKPLPVPKDLVASVAKNESETRNLATLCGNGLDFEIPVPDFNIFGKCMEDEQDVAKIGNQNVEDLKVTGGREVTIWKQIQDMKLRTRIQKICVLIETFNATVREYFEFSNRLEHDSIFIDFEVRKPSSNNSINIKV
ncbi:ATV_HP_G0048340.mRNA.1.CDS.1 [Saccharomyces cerevisiae]|nr:ATV_HP_G0145730.mRNA.1.CDS.1 [Saccharomyces cerevisiae]CAI5039244.1 ATV_HP_G0019430.mRNA.1.CDS.1 [Saccharomyces cerevisiae]CAI5130118.1 ATV_HP_G0048340.mRNA.1.CDS.1 [Saccharomyces cerevisiae]CAI6923252.1 ATV_HP_G0145730.mRNA.1.CDS.1 [Saccharomyces cerevisiae]CAI6954730.1 ATV_HP_G0019430.mRNA.1.CDS.1 [Saccharomyces cerevisiae]